MTRSLQTTHCWLSVTSWNVTFPILKYIHDSNKQTNKRNSIMLEPDLRKHLHPVEVINSCFTVTGPSLLQLQCSLKFLTSFQITLSIRAGPRFSPLFYGWCDAIFTPRIDPNPLQQKALAQRCQLDIIVRHGEIENPQAGILLLVGERLYHTVDGPLQCSNLR